MAFWGRLPVIVRAAVTGLMVATAGTLPWAFLVSLNIKHGSAVPWAVPPTALYLWLFWRYVRGAGWPRSTAPARRVLCRANPVSDDAWGMAIGAGLLGLVAVLLFQGVLARLVTLPPQQDIDPAKYPVVTVASWVLMSAAVAGVTEEVAFRGYLQGPIERRHGPVTAILITGLLFGFMHFTHPEVTLVLMPFYLAVAAVYGMLAYLTNSILPSMILHGGGNVFAAFALFAGGRSEWGGGGATAAPPQPLIWDTGADASFWLMLGGTLVMGAVAVWAYVSLARLMGIVLVRGAGHA
jgi:membrane protease YdiL (CAAX protease family)